MAKRQIDKSFLARQLSGVWRRRKDLKDIAGTLRRLRKAIRLKRLGVVRAVT
jgi:hypothetical protein